MIFNDTVSGTVALYTALHEAIFNDAALAILYNTNGDITKSRTIHPLDIAVGTKGSDLVWVHDSIRDGIICLRLDRIVAWSAAANEEPHGRTCVHHWGMWHPTDEAGNRHERRCMFCGRIEVEYREEVPEPHQDWEDSPQGRAVAGR